MKDVGVELGFLGSKMQTAKLSLKISRESYSGTYCRNVCWKLRKLEHGSFMGHTMYFWATLQ